MTDERIQKLEEQLEIIQRRNSRVEGDKAWEASRMRVGTICVITYMVAVAFLYVIGGHRPWIDGLVPPIGFFLSTQSLPEIKRWWIQNRYKDGK